MKRTGAGRSPATLLPAGEEAAGAELAHPQLDVTGSGGHQLRAVPVPLGAAGIGPTQASAERRRDASSALRKRRTSHYVFESRSHLLITRDWHEVDTLERAGVTKLADHLTGEVNTGVAVAVESSN